MQTPDVQLFSAENFKKNIFRNLGYIGIAITCVVYMIVIVLFVCGFTVKLNLSTGLFCAISCIIGFVIVQMFKIQGMSYAKEENKELLKRYYTEKTTDKKFKSISSYLVYSTITDFIIKSLPVALSAFGLVYVAVEGSKDWSLALLGIGNIFMFITTGFFSLISAYNAYTNNHIPYIKNKLKECENANK